MSSFSNKEPQPYTVRGIDLKCPVCNNDQFTTRRVLLNTPGMTFLNLDWADKNASCFVCSNCTHILWFLGDE